MIEKLSTCIVNNNLSLARIDYTFRQNFMGSNEPLFPLPVNSGTENLKHLRGSVPLRPGTTILQRDVVFVS